VAGRRYPASARARPRAGARTSPAWLLALLLIGASTQASAAPPAGQGAGEGAEGSEAALDVEHAPRLPADSPLYGPPYRRGLSAEVAVGVAMCQPGLLYASVCGRRGGGPATPGVGLRLGLGWRFNPHWLVAAAWVRQGHRPGGAFRTGQADGVILVGRGIVPLAARSGRDSRVDLGFELGLGWSQRAMSRDSAPSAMRSNGLLARPAVVLDGWVLADLAIGIELASHLNLHWQHCADQRCEPAPGPWVSAGLERRWVDGFTLAVRATGLLFSRL
jgi:hypothetical protein